MANGISVCNEALSKALAKACSNFYVVREPQAKFGLRARNMKFHTQNKE
jgi:hypothetical protein